MQALEDWKEEWWQDSPDLFPEPQTLPHCEPHPDEYLEVDESHRHIEMLKVQDAHYKELALLERKHQHGRSGRVEPHAVTRARLQALRDSAQQRREYFKEQTVLFVKAEEDLLVLKRNNRKREREAQSALDSLRDEVRRARCCVDEFVVRREV